MYLCERNVDMESMSFFSGGFFVFGVCADIYIFDLNVPINQSSWKVANLVSILSL